MIHWMHVVKQNTVASLIAIETSFSQLSKGPKTGNCEKWFFNLKTCPNMSFFSIRFWHTFRGDRERKPGVKINASAKHHEQPYLKNKKRGTDNWNEKNKNKTESKIKITGNRKQIKSKKKILAVGFLNEIPNIKNKTKTTYSNDKKNELKWRTGW